MTLLSRREFLEAAAVTGAAAAVGVGSASPAAASDLSRVARVAIHPAVGFARVGNSQEAFYFGPEVPGMAPRGPFKDPKGAMAKQAARFRIYGYDNQGRVLGEITAADAEITWNVNVANAKPIWYDPAEAFDVPNPPDCRRRNPEVIDRRTLVARATPRTVKGAGAEPQPLSCPCRSRPPAARGSPTASRVSPGPSYPRMRPSSRGRSESANRFPVGWP